MFRQVIAHRWSDGVSAERRAAFQVAVAELGQIPEVSSVIAGPDLRLFDGNHDFVTVLDFPDAGAAARYVAHPIHQAFISRHRGSLRDRVVVQHEWGAGDLVGLHHAKLPVTDAEASRQWYADSLGFAPDLDFAEAGSLAGASLRHPLAQIRLVLRRDPERAAAMAGFDALCFSVSNDADLDQLIAGLDARGVGHGGRRQGREGQAVELHDPDGIGIRVCTPRQHAPRADRY